MDTATHRPTLAAALLAAATAIPALASAVYLIVRPPVEPALAIASMPPQALVAFGTPSGSTFAPGQAEAQDQGLPSELP